MKCAVRLLPVVALAAAFTFLPAFGYQRRHAHLVLQVIGSTTMHRAAVYDRSPALASPRGSRSGVDALHSAPLPAQRSSGDPE